MNKNDVQSAAKQLAQLQVCLADIDLLIKRIQALSEELKTLRELPAGKQTDPANLEHAVSFAELRQFDIRCRNTLAQLFPAQAESWYIMEDKELASENEVLRHLQKKREVLQSSINSLKVNAGLQEKNLDKKNEDIIDLKPNFFGIGINFNAMLRKLKKGRSEKKKKGS